MPDLVIPIDPCNPAVVLACCGFLEVMALAGETGESWFELEVKRPRVGQFRCANASGLDLTAIAAALRSCPARVLARNGADTDATSPICLPLFNHELILDWWLNPFWDKSIGGLKLWAGQVTTKKIIRELPQLLPAAGGDFETTAYTSTRFGVDPRSAWRAIDLGYSPNEQGQESLTYPFVELLAAIGLQSFTLARQGYHWEYSLWSQPLPLAVARTSISRPLPFNPAALYRFETGKRGSYKFFGFAKPSGELP